MDPYLGFIRTFCYWGKLSEDNEKLHEVESTIEDIVSCTEFHDTDREIPS